MKFEIQGKGDMPPVAGSGFGGKPFDDFVEMGAAAKWSPGVHFGDAVAARAFLHRAFAKPFLECAILKFTRWIETGMVVDSARNTQDNLSKPTTDPEEVAAAGTSGFLLSRGSIDA